MISEMDVSLDFGSDLPPRPIDGAEPPLRRGNRVRLKPRLTNDVFNKKFVGRIAVIDSIEQTLEGTVHVAVIPEDDPDRDPAAAYQPAHRFLFAPHEMEPLVGNDASSPLGQILVAGIGNVFLGDDGFGCAVIQCLKRPELPQGVDVTDFSIRTLDLAYALGQPYRAAILVDTIPFHRHPGRLQLIEPDITINSAVSFERHNTNSSGALRLACRLGKLPPKIFLVGCESAEDNEAAGMSMNLSAPVAAAVGEAATVVVNLVRLLLDVDHTDIAGDAVHRYVLSYRNH